MLPLDNGSFAIGQVCEKSTRGGLAIILVFDRQFPQQETLSLQQLRQSVAAMPAFMANSFDSAIDRGDWKKLANIPPVLGRANLPAFRVAGLPLGLLLESYDLKHKRLARIGEINRAPNNYSISPKGLQNAVKAYFKIEGTSWEPRFDKLLFKNVVPFGR